MASAGVFFRPVEADNGSASAAFTAEIDGKAVSCFVFMLPIISSPGWPRR